MTVGSSSLAGESTASARSSEYRDAWFARRLSLLFGFLMLTAKTGAYFLKGSSAILADAAESVVHVMKIAFAAFSLRLSVRPATPNFLYGFERIAFLSARFEGAMIVLAAIVIIVTAVTEWMAGLQLENLGMGAILVLAAAGINAVLGWHLVRTGCRVHSLILRANGTHVLADSWTSFGVILGVVLVLLTRWTPFDPLVAIAVALIILWSGGQLIWKLAEGLLDYSDPSAGRETGGKLDATSAELGVGYHGISSATPGTGSLSSCTCCSRAARPWNTLIGWATSVEERLSKELGVPAEVTTHLETEGDHADVHAREHYNGVPKLIEQKWVWTGVKRQHHSRTGEVAPPSRRVYERNGIVTPSDRGTHGASGRNAATGSGP